MTTDTPSIAADRNADDLLKDITIAVVAINKAEAVIAKAKADEKVAQTEVITRSKEIGMLLIEAKKLHPETEHWKA